MKVTHLLRFLLSASAAGLFGVAAHGEIGGKEMIMMVSWGDQIAGVGAGKEAPLTSVEAFRQSFRRYKEAGVDIILFRVDVLRMARDYDWPDPRITYGDNAPKHILEAEIKQWEGAQAGLKSNLLKPIVEIAHQEGLKIFAWNTTFDEGMPLREPMVEKGYGFGGGGSGKDKPWYSKVDIGGDMVSRFVEAHPECVMVDRTQKKHNWGTLEFAYPEARKYAVGYNQSYLAQYPFDGIYVDFRNEDGHPEFGDEFGFAPPIVREFQRRYGVNILHDEFDVEKWRRLCGEYLTEYIRELHAMAHARGKPLYVGIPQGNYLGLPNGNMYVDWQGWASRHLVDGLVIGAYTGKFIFPDQVGYGYLTDMEFGIGLPDLFEDLRDHYSPLCAKAGVKLYVWPHSGIPAHISFPDIAKSGVDGIMGRMATFDQWKAATGAR